MSCLATHAIVRSLENNTTSHLNHMDYNFLQNIRENNPALALIRSISMPFVASFLWKTFRAGDKTRWEESDLQRVLDDYVYQYAAQDIANENSNYLQLWTQAGYLRQFYVEQDDSPRYELTPAIDKALHWLEGFKERAFVGTESRLKNIFELLASLIEESDPDIARRVTQLEKVRDEIEMQIDRAKRGDVTVLSDMQIRERFAQLDELARHLLRDFSEVDQNFRDLDRRAREKIATLEGKKGEILEHIFQDSDIITHSEQGRSFRAFFEFLLSADIQSEFETNLHKIYELAPIKHMGADPFLGQILYRLLDSSELILATQGRLSSQLRRFLDQRIRLENKRIATMIHDLELQLLSIKSPPSLKVTFSESDSFVPEILCIDRPLYQAPLKSELLTSIDIGDDKEASAENLFNIEYVDERTLTSNIQRCLEQQQAISLLNVIEKYPISKGVAEIIGYLKIASHDTKASINHTEEQTILFLSGNKQRKVTLPQIFFYR